MEAAIREVGEETSIDELEFEWGDRYMETGPVQPRQDRALLPRQDEPVEQWLWARRPKRASRSITSGAG